MVALVLVVAGGLVSQRSWNGREGGRGEGSDARLVLRSMPAPGIGAEWRAGLAFLAIIFVRAILVGDDGCGGWWVVVMDVRGRCGGRWCVVSEDSTSECDVK